MNDLPWRSGVDWQTSQRIKNIAYTSDDMLMLFKDTPVFNILQLRRNVANEMFNSVYNQNLISYLTLLDNELKAYFNL